MDDTMLDGLDPNERPTNPPDPSTALASPRSPKPPAAAPHDEVVHSLQSVIRRAMCDNAADFSVQPALFAWTIACRHCGWQILAAGPDLSRAELLALREHRTKHTDAHLKHDRCTAPSDFACLHRLPRLPDEFAQ